MTIRYFVNAYRYIKYFIFVNTVKPVYNGHPWDPKILAVVDRWPLQRGSSIKIAIEFDLAGLRLPVVGRWPLFRGGR
jgi:hypothetical protein